MATYNSQKGKNMRITNVIKSKIASIVDKQVEAQMTELYAPKKAKEDAFYAEAHKIWEEACAKMDALAANYDGKVNHYSYRDNWFEKPSITFASDVEVNNKAAEIRARATEAKMDLEIRAQMGKDAEEFFKMLADFSL